MASDTQMYFECPICGELFRVDWNYEEFVQCSNCKRWWQVGWDESDDGLIGPWISSIATPAPTDDKF